jgi:Protein of unknown function (DUF998)
MPSNAAQGATPVPAAGPGFDRGAAVTRSLLGYGVVVGPFYLTVGLIQALVRDGFDLARHSLSVLTNGPGGWVQTANFVLSGLMLLAAAVGFARVPVPRLRPVGICLGAFGLSMIVAAGFPADPMDGFPPGTPEGIPASISTTGLVHFAAGAIGFMSLAASCLFAARAMSGLNPSSLARLSAVCGVAIILGFFSGAVLPSVVGPVLGIWFSVIVGWAWLAIMSVHLYRLAPEPNCAQSERGLT